MMIMNMIKSVRSYFHRLEDAREERMKMRIREDFILAHWDELKLVSQRVNHYEKHENTPGIHVTFVTLDDLNLLLSPEEMKDFQYVIDQRKVRK